MAKKKPSAKRTAHKREELAHRLLRQLRADGAVRAGMRVGVAVSGGADSVSLLRLLLEVREELGFVLSLVHFNHKLRGQASDADEKFVAKLAAQHGLEYHVVSENIAAKAKRERANLEEVARRSRYAYFERLVAEGKVDRIAVAHTADDQAETVLAHILRGTGLAGMAGIHPEAGGVFRPLLKVRREELRAYLRRVRQVWCEDATNRDTKRTRARIRHKLMPLLEREFQSAAVEHLCQLADLARVDEDWLNFAAELRVRALAKEEQGEFRIKAEDLVGRQCVPDEAKSYDQRRFRERRTAMSTRMIRKMVKRVKPRTGQLSAVHVEAVLCLAEQGGRGKSLSLPGGVEVRREREQLVFRARAGAMMRNVGPKPYVYLVDLTRGEATVRPGEFSYALRFTVIDWPAQGRETKVTGAVLDRDRLEPPLVVRNWQPGDAVRLAGRQKRHKLSRLLNEAGVSRWEKATWPVLTSAGRVAWARGLPAPAEFAADEKTGKGVLIAEVPPTSPWQKETHTLRHGSPTV